MVDDPRIDAILALITGGVSVTKACRAEKLSKRDWYARVAADPKLAERFVNAKTLGYACYADEIVELADKARMGTKTKVTPDGTTTERGDMVERTRLQIDARKWLLSKLLPKQYGERVDLNHAGNITVEVVRFADPNPS